AVIGALLRTLPLGPAVVDPEGLTAHRSGRGPQFGKDRDAVCTAHRAHPDGCSKVSCGDRQSDGIRGAGERAAQECRRDVSTRRHVAGTDSSWTEVGASGLRVAL